MIQWTSTRRFRLRNVAFVMLALSLSVGAFVLGKGVTAAPDDSARQAGASIASAQGGTNSGVQLDRSGRKQVGKASFYADRYSGKTMADGTPMHLYSNNAASMTLPLGTTAQVTNLKTGLSATVTIRDRGPYIKGRIVDLSPATARQIGLDKRSGLTKVVVAPLFVPQTDGSVWIAPMALARNN